MPRSVERQPVARPTVTVHDGSELPDDVFELRRRVFVEEQSVPADLELDGRDGDAVHAIAREGDDAVGTGRLRRLDDVTGKIERVAVLPNYRGEGLGRRLMEALEGEARARDVERIELHAQLDVEGFYHALGYVTVSDVFEEAGMAHVEMEKRLQSSTT